jgi:tripartite ATP-independent transporter DctM subunit
MTLVNPSLPVGGRVSAAVQSLEHALSVVVLGMTVLIPGAEAIVRLATGSGYFGTAGFAENLTLWVGYVGAVLAARYDRHLRISHLADRLRGTLRRVACSCIVAVTTAVSGALCFAAIGLVRAELSNPSTVGSYLPIWCFEAVMPVALGAITLRYIVQSGAFWIAALAGLPLALLAGVAIHAGGPVAIWLLLSALAVATALGAPLFVLIGGAALTLFVANEIPVAGVMVEAYRLTASPIIPAIPIFTLVGFVLTESRASARIVRLFRAFFGWIPGGVAVAAVLVTAFTGSFTGASGVLILAVGGLLLPALTSAGYGERFGIGLITGSGSIGLLLPPSLAIILVAVVAQVSILDLFVAGFAPALLMIGAAAAYGAFVGRTVQKRSRFDRREALAALNDAKWELMIPVVALVAIFGGFTTFNEAGSLTAIYALVVAMIVRRELHPVRDLPRVLVRCATLVGGVFMVLGVAMGMTSFLVDAQIPDRLAAWAITSIDSPLVFLLALNVFLLLVGCIMDIFSAIAVVLPLLLPISAAFGVHPVHLGIIFIANLELGYLTPPVGMNLYLASYRFERPFSEICYATLPMLAVLMITVLAVTYLPLLVPVPGMSFGEP